MDSVSEYLTAQRQFEIDAHQDNTEAKVLERKAALEAEAEHELYEKLGNTLADFQTRPTWTEEKTDASTMCIYSLTMKVVFKP